MTLLSNVNSSPSLNLLGDEPNAKIRTISSTQTSESTFPLFYGSSRVSPEKLHLARSDEKTAGVYHRTAAGGVCTCSWPHPPMIRPTNKRGCFNGRKWSTGGHDTSAITAWRHRYIDSRQRGQKPPHSRRYRPLSSSARTIIARTLDTAAFRIELPTRRNRCNGIDAGL